MDGIVNSWYSEICPGGIFKYSPGQVRGNSSVAVVVAFYCHEVAMNARACMGFTNPRIEWMHKGLK